MAVSPKKRKAFLVDVKGLYSRNPWIIKQKERRPDLYFILAFVPDNKPNEFFVLSQQEVTREIKRHLRNLGRPSTYPVTGFYWSTAQKYKDAWGTLPV